MENLNKRVVILAGVWNAGNSDRSWLRSSYSSRIRGRQAEG
jgi:hypothetical protein